MNVGGKRRILVPAKAGYGKKGAAPDIPPNADLEFDVELVNVK
jgi:FKBP-type peptidyl-prolyl cis-trans isomerase